MNRRPGIFLKPGTTKLHVRVDRKGKGNDGCDTTDEITLEKWTRVHVKVSKRRLEVIFDSELKCSKDFAGDVLPIKNAPLWISNPWTGHPYALIDKLEISERVYKKPLANLRGDLENTGKKCLKECNEEQGECSFCGGGLCCRVGFKGNGCVGNMGGLDEHECVSPSDRYPGVVHEGQECFDMCKKKGGKCSWCGGTGYCCKKGVKEGKCDGKIGSKEAHICTSLTPRPLTPVTPKTKTTGPACWIRSYGRGLGKPLSHCYGGWVKSGLLCYPKCRSKYTGVGPVCQQNCPSGFINGLTMCHRLMHTISSRRNCPFTDKCGLLWARGCSKCPSGYTNLGCLCRRPPKMFFKHTYGRGLGKPMGCSPGSDQSGLLCYPKCSKSYVGIGPMCLAYCPSSHPHKCGPLMCTKNRAECHGKLGNIFKNVILKGGIGLFPTGALGLAAELCIPKCGDPKHLMCNILGKINDAVSVCPLDILECPKALKCLLFMGKQASLFAGAITRFLGGSAFGKIKSFFSQVRGVGNCLKQGNAWTKNTSTNIRFDNSFKKFQSCIRGLFFGGSAGRRLLTLSAPTVIVSVSARGVLGIVGGGTSFDTHFGISKGSLKFSYTKCAVLTLPKLTVTMEITVSLIGNGPAHAMGSHFVMSTGPTFPKDVSLGVDAQMIYDGSGSSVVGMGTKFSIGGGWSLSPLNLSCGSCETKPILPN